ncbi:MAG: hypothetical protein ACK4WM_09175 [Thermoflexales bacterium]
MSRALDDELEEALGAPRMPRKSRTQEERVKTWQPPSVLPEPDRQPGYVYRWVRVSSLGQKDAPNVSAKFREGWEPVRIEEQPQFRMLVDPDSRFKDNIEVAGLLLCKAPVELMEQRRGYYKQQNQAQIVAVDNNLMRINDERMPLFRHRESKVVFSRR